MITQPDSAFIAQCIGVAKRDLKARQNVKSAFSAVRDDMARQVDALLSVHARGESVIPVIDYQQVVDGRVSDAARLAVRKRGCAIIKSVFDAKQISDWNDELEAYLEENHFLDAVHKRDATFKRVNDVEQALIQIYGIYWSRPQIQLRQAEAMANVKRFLNYFWDVRSPVGDEFDPDHELVYADRIRRRAPGDKHLGLPPHIDGGSFERWLDPAFRSIYAPIFNGAFHDYDPWRAAYRTQTREYRSPNVCPMFRSFQGWTAMTQQGPGDGTLQLLPVANSMAYLLLRSLQDDIAEDELCLALPGESLKANETWHPEAVAGLMSIPVVEPGDTVWWHPDVLHGVENEHSGSQFSNVMYIGASPECAKNRHYAERQAKAFLAGNSAPDYPEEHFEADFGSRAQLGDLTPLGRAQMAL